MASLLMGTVGVPLPHAMHRKRGAPFPCQDYACGCATAEQCWRSCCCFTNRQKLAWAAEHQVTPPDTVAEAAARERPKLAARPCCAANSPGAACCDHESMVRATDGNREHAHPDATEGATPGEAASAGDWELSLVIAIRARRCQGPADPWLTFGAVSPPPERVAMRREIVRCGTAFPAVDLRFGIVSSPPTPPPRV